MFINKRVSHGVARVGDDNQTMTTAILTLITITMMITTIILIYN